MGEFSIAGVSLTTLLAVWGSLLSTALGACPGKGQRAS